MTPERLEEIRQWLRRSAAGPLATAFARQFVEELLAEIDRLNRELATQRTSCAEIALLTPTPSGVREADTIRQAIHDAILFLKIDKCGFRRDNAQR